MNCKNYELEAKRKENENYLKLFEKEDLDGLYMRDIIREEVTPDDARLR